MQNNVLGDTEIVNALMEYDLVMGYRGLLIERGEQLLEDTDRMIRLITRLCSGMNPDFKERVGNILSQHKKDVKDHTDELAAHLKNA